MWILAESAKHTLELYQSVWAYKEGGEVEEWWLGLDKIFYSDSPLRGGCYDTENQPDWVMIKENDEKPEKPVFSEELQSYYQGKLDALNEMLSFVNKEIKSIEEANK